MEFLINLSDITEIVSKNFLLRPHAFELYETKFKKSYFINVFSKDIRDNIYLILSGCGVTIVDDCRSHFKKMKYEKMWCGYKMMSSFDYIMLINKYSSRSFNDTSQYYIMPWVGPCGCNNMNEILEPENDIKITKLKYDGTIDKTTNNYTDKELKLFAEGKVRDLCKSIGVHNSAKYKEAVKNYANGPQEIEVDIYGDSPFNLKFGYMNSQICLSYLVRIEPFTSLFIKYNGKLDSPDRMLSDSITLWKKVISATQCNNELIPEWFYLPQIFTNKNFCNFGRDAKNKIVSDVVLPEWANNNPFYY